MSVTINGIAKSLSSEWLKSTFSQCGTVTRMDFTMEEGNTVNSAVIHFSTLEEAQTAVRELNGKEVNGSAIKVALNESIKSATVPQTRQVSPTPALGQLKFGERKQSIFQSPPEVGLKLKTDKSTAKPSSDFHINLEKSNPESPSSTLDSEHVETSKSSVSLTTFSFTVPKDHIPIKMTTSRKEPHLSEASSSNISAKETTKSPHRSSSQFHTSTSNTGPYQRVSPTPVTERTQTHYKSKSVSPGGRSTFKTSPTPKRLKKGSDSSETHRHHPYLKKLHHKSLSLDGGKFKHKKSSQFSQPSSSTEKGNPFLSKLKSEKTTPVSVPSGVTGVASSPLQRNFREQQTKSIPLSDRLVCKLLLKHPQVVAQLQAFSKDNGVTCSVAVDGNSITLSGFQIDIEKCEPKMTELIEALNQQITSGPVAQHCMYIPFLATPEALGQLESIADKNFVQIDISWPSSEQGFVSLKDFAVSYNGQFKNSLLQTSDLQYLTIPDIHLGSELPVWSYSLCGGITVKHTTEDSQIIENIFRYGGPPQILQYNKVLHTFNFFESVDHMSQINLHTGERFSLIRSPVLVSKNNDTVTPEYAMNFRLRGLHDNIIKANDEICQVLQTAVIEHQYEPSPSVVQDRQKMLEFLLIMVNYARQYCIHLRPIEFRENNSKPILKFGSTREYGERVKLELIKYSLDIQKRSLEVQQNQVLLTHMSHAQLLLRQQHPQQMCAFPNEWEEQSFDPDLKDVSPESLEWKQVLVEMLKTMQNVQIKRLQRIQNKTLWKKYCNEMADMSESNNGETNVKGLFHGTRTIDPLTVVQSEKGIDFRHSSVDSNLWGRGSYFAVNASYSDKYSYHCDNGDKQMLLVCVLTGKSCECKEPNRELIKPPPLNPFSSKCYDTVKGFTGGSEIYVVYEHNKSYPAYLITYQ